MKKTIWLVIFCLVLSINVFGQEKEITSEDFYQPLRDVYKFKGSFRKTSKEEFFKDGKLSGTIEIVDEFISSPEKRRYSYFEKFGNKTEKKEIIQIGETYYCRENGSKWKKSDSWCDSMLSGISNVMSSKFTVKDVKFNNQDAKLYQQYTTFSSDKVKISYLQIQFWLNSDGFLIREETEYGEVAPKTTNSKEIEIYEYNPKNLKIVAPIIKSVRKKS